MKNVDIDKLVLAFYYGTNKRGLLASVYRPTKSCVEIRLSKDPSFDTMIIMDTFWSSDWEKSYNGNLVGVSVVMGIVDFMLLLAEHEWEILS